jgi:hypothetical protein
MRLLHTAARTRALFDDPNLVSHAAHCGGGRQRPRLGLGTVRRRQASGGRGVSAHAQDVEEWCHVERFTRPAHDPVILLAPPGRAHWRALTALADLLLPTPVPVREEFAALVLPVFAPYLAAGLAQRLGRAPFLHDPEPP